MGSSGRGGKKRQRPRRSGKKDASMAGQAEGGTIKYYARERPRISARLDVEARTFSYKESKKRDQAEVLTPGR